MTFPGDARRVVVVGGAGFVGSNLVRALLDAGVQQVIVVDNLLSATIENVPDDPAVQFVLGSIADDRTLAGLPADLDYLFHLATYHGNQSSIADPLADHENNALTSLKLFDRLKDFAGLRKVVYAAAGCAVAEKTYGDAAATAEDAPASLHHDSPYSISKLIGEMYANFYHRHHGLPVVKARFQNVYGPGEVLGAGRWRGTPHTVWRNVVPTFVYRSLNDLPLPLENEGRASRDFVYVGDVVRGLLACAGAGDPGEVYNIASGEETTIRELAERIDAITGNTAPPEVRPARAWDRSGHRFGDPTKARVRLGFRATVPLEEGLHRTIEWTKANTGLIERCISQHSVFMPELRQLVGSAAESGGGD